MKNENTASKKGCFTSAEQTPKELIDVCLECKRMSCSGECSRYSEAVKEYKKSIGGSKFSSLDSKTRYGVEPKRYEFRGSMLSVPEMSKLTGISRTTLRTWLKRGLTMEEIVKRYE